MPTSQVVVAMLAASAAQVAAQPARANHPAWTRSLGTIVRADGALIGRVCCTGQLLATRPLELPRGGRVRVAVRAPCGAATAIGVRAPGGAATWVVGPRQAPFVGTLELVVAPGPGPRELVVAIEGGRACCGEAAIEAVQVVAP